MVPAKLSDAAVEAAAESLYRQLLELGIETVIDDRDAKPRGVKFKDWDLIGVPFRLVLGRGVAGGLAELKPRAGTVSEIPLLGAAAAVADLVRAGRRPAVQDSGSRPWRTEAEARGRYGPGARGEADILPDACRYRWWSSAR